MKLKNFLVINSKVNNTRALTLKREYGARSFNDLVNKLIDEAYLKTVESCNEESKIYNIEKSTKHQAK